MKKQIEEMAKEICSEYDCVIPCQSCAYYAYANCRDVKSAEKLYTAGYRKASEVALEVINTALSKIQIMISCIKSQEENGNITEFNGGAKTSLEIVCKDFAELKRKYTEEERNEMESEKIKNALGCCIKTQCENCCNLGSWHEQWNCMTDLMKKALAIITSQEGEDYIKLLNEKELKK